MMVPEEKLRQAISSHQKKRILDRELTKSAVLVPVFSKSEGQHILFIKRSDKVAYHKGQISFPGGTYDESDSSLLHTALREGWEEIGLEHEDVDILGELDDTTTANTGFIISPFVAFIPYPYEFKKNRMEIDKIISIPLAALLGEDNFRQEYQVIGNESILVYFYEYEGQVVWGATARIVKQLVDILRPHDSPPTKGNFLL